LLLHLVDVAPIDESDPVESFKIIEKEVQAYSAELGERERWLVLNKVDLLLEEERDSICQGIVDQLNWQGRVFMVSAAAKIGTKEMSYQIMQYLDEQAMENQPSSHATYSP